MGGNLKRSIVRLAGWSLVGLGVLGLLLPVLPGVLLLLAGVSMLSSEYVWAHRILQRLGARFPNFSKRFRAAEARARTRFAWLFRHPPQPPEA